MLDPFPIGPPPFLVAAVKPFADALHLHSLPLHAHEVLFAIGLYFFTSSIFSPWLSSLVFPNIYPRMSKRGKINWDVHVVSFVQACVINALSLYIIWFDEERKTWRHTEDWAMRVWGYYGSGGLCQSFALGYFIWDLTICSMNLDIFGWGMLAHAVSAVAVFGLGYRPYIYFSAPIFLLYELSSPFLNIHWFCDKLDLTGSMLQAINGVFLVITFFSARLVWGIYSSCWVFWDMYRLVRDGNTNLSRMVPAGKIAVMSTEELLAISKDPIAQMNAFNREEFIPLWIPIVYLVSNVTLNSLNIFWFGKMIETIRKRFDPPFGTKGVGPEKILYNQLSDEDVAKEEKRKSALTRPKLEERLDSDLGVGSPGKVKASDWMPKSEDSEADSDLSAAEPGKKKKGSVRAARRRAEEVMNGPVGTVEDTKFERPAYDDSIAVDATGSTRKSARSRRKA